MPRKQKSETVKETQPLSPGSEVWVKPVEQTGVIRSHRHDLGKLWYVVAMSDDWTLTVSSTDIQPSVPGNAA